MSEDADDRRWNVPRCAKEIRALLDRVGSLEQGSPNESVASSSPPSDLGGGALPPTKEGFIGWLPNAILSFINSEGRAVLGTQSAGSTFIDLSTAWLVVMAASGAEDPELFDFWEWATHKGSDLDNWNQRRKEHYLRKKGLPVAADIAAKAQAAAVGVDRNAMSTTVTAAELERESMEAELAMKGGEG